MELNIQMFGGRGASSENIKRISVFKGEKNFKQAIQSGYRIYMEDDLELTGENYEEIANKLIKKGNKVRVRQGKKNTYTVLYKK